MISDCRRQADLLERPRIRGAEHLAQSPDCRDRPVYPQCGKRRLRGDVTRLDGPLQASNLKECKLTR